MFKNCLLSYFSLQQNLAKSSYGSSPLWLHHKIDQKNTDCNCALIFNIVASDANDIGVIAVTNPKIVILAITACTRRSNRT
jgi:hypothetical protein